MTTDNDQNGHFILLARSCFMLIMIRLMLAGYAELGKDREQTPCNLPKVAGKR